MIRRFPVFPPFQLRRQSAGHACGKSAGETDKSDTIHPLENRKTPIRQKSDGNNRRHAGPPKLQKTPPARLTDSDSSPYTLPDKQSDGCESRANVPKSDPLEPEANDTLQQQKWQHPPSKPTDVFQSVLGLFRGLPEFSTGPCRRPEPSAVFRRRRRRQSELSL